MKKIYLDWNVINHLDEELYDFILKNQSHFVYVYSPAHFSDLMKSYQEGDGNTFFEEDLKRLEVVCESHLMMYSDKKLNLYRCSPTEFMEKEGKDYPVSKFLLNPNLLKESMKIDGLDLYGLFSESLKSISFGKTIELPLFGIFSNALEFLDCSLAFIEKMLTDNEFVRTIRKGAAANVNDKEITCINDYNPQEVIGAINSFFTRHGANVDIEELIKKTIIDEQQGNEMLVFESIYASLDIMRFHPDKKGLMNTLTDAEHAFYGSFCDVLVTDDAKMTLKAKAVYSYYGVGTKILSKKELMDYLINELQGECDLGAPSRTLLSVQRVPKEYDNDIEFSRIKLEHPFLSYFNIMEFQVVKSTGWSFFLFARETEFKECVYYTETDKLFNIIKGILCDSGMIEAFEKEYVDKFNSNDRSAGFSFYLSNSKILAIGMSENEDYGFPLLALYYIEEQANDPDLLVN